MGEVSRLPRLDFSLAQVKRGQSASFEGGTQKKERPLRREASSPNPSKPQFVSVGFKPPQSHKSVTDGRFDGISQFGTL